MINKYSCFSLHSMCRRIIVLVPVLFFIGCSVTSPPSRYQQHQDSAPIYRMDPASIQDATPKVEPPSRQGNKSPYEVRGITYQLLPDSQGYSATGMASWYGSKFHGHTTSNGEIYNMFAMSAAHKTLPIPTYLRVTNIENGRKVIVRVNDRGPFHGNRIIDLSYAAAMKLGFANQGVAAVNIEAIDPAAWNNRHNQTVPVTRQIPEVGTQGIFIQVAAFSQLESAQQLRRQLLLQTDQSVVILRDNQISPNLHKVQIGPVDNLELAQQIRQSLHANGHDMPMIIGLPKI